MLRFWGLCSRNGVSTHYLSRGIWPEELILHPSAPQINFCSSPAIHCCDTKDSGVLCYVQSLCLTDSPRYSCLTVIGVVSGRDVGLQWGWEEVRMIGERELVVGHISMCLSILMLILSWDEAQSSQANNGSGARKSAPQSSRPWKACRA